MILNLPTKSDFENAAYHFLNQSLNMIYTIWEETTDYTETKGYLPLHDEIQQKEIWEYKKGTLNTSLILIHQGIESLMKAEICDKTPLLLLDIKRTEWPTLPVSKDKDFNELFTISGEALVRTFSSVNKNINQDILNLIEDIRVLRNKITHSVYNDSLTAKYLINTILKTYTFFKGKDKWWHSLKHEHYKHPTFGIFDDDFETVLPIRKLNFAENIIGLSSLNNHFTINLKSRRYYCPYCLYALGRGEEDLNSKWCFLIPQNKKGSTKVICINCDNEIKVARKKCEENDCKGDVISIYEHGKMWESICLSCKSDLSYVH